MTEQTVTTTAVGQTSAPPDQVGVQFAANAVEPSVAAARRSVAEQAAALREALADAGVPDDRVRTEKFNIHRQRPGEPRTHDDGGDDAEEYEATESIGVTLHDLDRLEGVLSGGVDAGVQVADVTFTFRTGTHRELQREAIADAVETARAKASAAAAAEGVAVGEVRSIVTDDGSRPRRTGSGGAPLSMDTSGSVESGPIDVDVRVEVEYGLVEASE